MVDSIPLKVDFIQICPPPQKKFHFLEKKMPKYLTSGSAEWYLRNVTHKEKKAML